MDFIILVFVIFIWLKISKNNEKGINKDITKFIDYVKNSNPNAVELYMNGQCYKFALLLQYCFPKGTIFYEPLQGHIYYKYKGYYYDIRGQHDKIPDAFDIKKEPNLHPELLGLKDDRILLRKSKINNIQVKD